MPGPVSRKRENRAVCDEEWCSVTRAWHGRGGGGAWREGADGHVYIPPQPLRGCTQSLACSRAQDVTSLLRFWGGGDGTQALLSFGF